MSASKEVKFTLNVMVNKEKTKVIFAEVDSDFADVLLSFLTLPLGKIVSLLENYYGSNSTFMGSLHTLRRSVPNLDVVHFGTDAAKKMLLNPRSLFEDECCKLKLNFFDAQPTKYFSCGSESCKKEGSHYWTMYYGSSNCKFCGKTLNSEISVKARADGNGGVFTPKTMSFLICDDLEMLPNVPGSILHTLDKLGIKDTGGTEMRTKTVGLNEIMDLFKLSLLSETPLSDLILHKRPVDSATRKSELGILLRETEKQQSLNYGKNVTVKAIIQKSTNKFLMIQAQDDFVDLLFSLLTLPLGGVVRVLGSETFLGSIGNLHKSLSELIVGVHLKSHDMKNGLLKSVLPPMFRSSNRMLSFDEQRSPTLYYRPDVSPYFFTYMITGSEYNMRFKDPRGEGRFIKQPGTFLIADDLTVAPSCVASSLSVINGLQIPLSDIGELEIGIGLEEMINIFKASLTSVNALSKGLSFFLEKQPKQEQ